MAVISNGMLGFLGEFASILHGAVASGLKLVTNLLTSGFKAAFQFNEAAMAFSRQAGLSAKQAQAYTEVLSRRAEELGEKYGIAAEEVTKLEKNLAKATGRVIMLSNQQADLQVAINRTIGEDTANQFSQTMMRTMGAQYNTVQGAVTKAYAIAAKKGLDAAGMAAKVAQNLSMANRLTFKSGVDGITKMVALSEKLGFNLSSMESAANKFMDLQDSIENAAKLSMLGGAAGALGGNPLDMTYEANYSMEDFTTRVTKMVAGLSRFNAETGIATSNGMAKDFARQIASALGMSMDEVMSIANKQAEVRFKEQTFGADLDRITGGDEKMRDFFLNKAQYNAETKQLEMTDRSGKARELSYFTNTKEGKEELKEMMRFNKMTDEEIVREQAEAVVSIRERLEGYFTTIQAMFAKEIAPYIPKIQQFLGELYNIVKPHFQQIAGNVKKMLEELLTKDTIDKVKDGITTVATAVLNLAKFLTSKWQWLVGGMLLTPLISVVTWIATQISAYRAANAVPGGPGAGMGGAGGAAGRLSPMQVFRNARGTGSSVLSSGRYAANYAWNAVPGVRATAIGGGVIAAGLAGYQAYDAISSHNKRTDEIRADQSLSAAEKNQALENSAKERNRNLAGAGGGLAGAAIGGLIGTLGGPLGVAIGVAAGEAIGNWVGKGIAGAVQGKEQKYAAGTPEHHWDGNYGGGNKPVWFVGGNRPTGDEIDAKLSSGEGVVPVKKQIDFLGAIDDLKGALGMTTYLASTTVNGGSSIAQTRNNATSNYLASTTVNGGSSIAQTRNNATSNYLASPNANGESSIVQTRNSLQNNSTTNYLASPSINDESSVIRERNNLQNSVINNYFTSPNTINTSPVVAANNNTHTIPTEIFAKPTGEKADISTSSVSQFNQIGGNVDVNMKPINGTITLVGGGNSQNIDIRSLLGDVSFVSALKDVIRESMASDINGGRIMMDTAYMRGMPSQSTTMGRLTS